MRRKRRVVTAPLIPDKPTANLTASMRAELSATPEVFENQSGSAPQSSSSTSHADQEESEPSTKTTPTPKVSPVKEVLPAQPEKDVRKRDVEITNVNDVQSYEADVIGTFSQSSGTISYDSIKSMNNASLEDAKIEGKYIQNTEKELQKVMIEQMSRSEGKTPEMRVISDAELNRRIKGEEAPFESQEALPATPHWGEYEAILTKKCIEEVVENFFASPRDDIEVTMRLTRRDMYPRLHVELAPLYEDIQIAALRSQPQPTSFPMHPGRRGRFDDLLRTGSDEYLPRRDSMQSMEDRSAAMCHTTYSDTTTARPPSHDYLTTAYSYLVAFVKSVVPNRGRSSTKTSE